MRDIAGRNAPQVESLKDYARQHRVFLRAIELDVQSEASAEAAVAQIVAEQGRLDVVVHNAGHMSYGPAEAFLPEQFSQLFDINVLGTQRVNRAALPLPAPAEKRPAALGRQQQYARWHSAIPGTLFCRQSRDGRRRR
ncbi:Uncharacterized NAD-dependent oxidoreductase MAP_4146 [Cedecea neteri]|uniref:Uncharacterized NAD-dependent oxidoreductase MAP_4146 n=1 Tax=Cedecea neteri TaxID=158822 RepID=A0A2X3L1V7_9ENTR|nr:Uncharacterized NAD-dependent oxidoreductase MAP_4146 [Cedecea neteri]